MDQQLIDQLISGEISLDLLTPAQKEQFIALMDEKIQRVKSTNAHKDLISFADAVYPNYSVGQHHKIMAEIFKDVAEGRKRRVIINIAPRHGKSELTSYLFPAWFLGQKPDAKIIMATHTASLSEDFGRRVRNLINSEDYKKVFPNTKLADDSKSAGAWNTTAGGKYYAVGVGGALAGRGADLLVIDDPHSEQDAKSGTRTVFDQAWSWYQTGPRQRLMWGGAIIVVMCMTGDTPVLMADGTEKELRYIRPGDEVATFENGAVTTSKVLNWQSNGIDSIYKVRTQSGIIVHANERHPFLVDDAGNLKWKRLNELKLGDILVSLKGATVQQEPKQSPGCVRRVCQKIRIIVATPKRHIKNWAFMVSGKALSALSAISPQFLKDFAQGITAASAGPTGTTGPLPKKEEKSELKVDTGLPLQNMTLCTKYKMESAQCAGNLPEKMSELIGGVNSVLITVMTAVKCAASFVMTAISPWAMGKQQASLNAPLSTYSVSRDQIVEIVAAGKEEVFDVQIERTENFIANGLVSHNTRWSQVDLTARLIEHQTRNPDADQWEVIEFPAILPSGKSLWPEKWPLEELMKTRATIDAQYWNAQYMQDPTSEEAAIIKREMWREWTLEEPPSCTFIIQSWDTAHETKTSSDFSACTTWGLFINEGEGDTMQLILLDAFRGRYEFPELKKKAADHYAEWQPDICIIEKKAAGAPLIQELRRAGIPVQEYSPSRGNDKTVRINAVADVFASGKVWAPPTRWAQDVIEEMAAYPQGEHDDLADTATQAILRFRQGGFLRLASDEDERTPWYRPRRAAYY